MNQDYIVQATKGVPLGSRMNVAKEALQRHLLASLQNEGLLTNAAFIGGTALRLLHELPRYSEDLDFIWKNKAAEDQLPKWNKCLLKAVKTLGAVPGFDAKYKSKDDAKVPKRGLSIWVNSTAPAFTPFAPHGIQISFDIDLDPPSNTEPETRLMQIEDTQIEIPSLTLPSLMTGKLHILLTRPDREKGRDWFDYTWYRQKNILPNIPMFDSAIQQTADGPEARYWTSYVRQRAKTIQWINVRGDVKSFLENPAEADALNETRVSNLTPYPDFAEIEAEIREKKTEHPLLLNDNPVLTDIEQASLEGEMPAIEVLDLIKALKSES
jgi:hypothetical protein